MNLLRGIGQKATLPNGQPAPPQDVEVMLSGGGTVYGRAENVYGDGIAVRDGERAFYIPVTGLVAVIYNEPAEIYDEPRSKNRAPPGVRPELSGQSAQKLA